METKREPGPMFPQPTTNVRSVAHAAEDVMHAASGGCVSISPQVHSQYNCTHVVVGWDKYHECL